MKQLLSLLVAGVVLCSSQTVFAQGWRGPGSRKSVQSEIAKIRRELNALESRVNKSARSHKAKGPSFGRFGRFGGFGKFAHKKGKGHFASMHKGHFGKGRMHGKAGFGKGFGKGHGKFAHGKFGHGKFGHGKFGHGKFGHGKFGHGKFGHGKFAMKKGFGRGFGKKGFGKGFGKKGFGRGFGKKGFGKGFGRGFGKGFGKKHGPAFGHRGPWAFGKGKFGHGFKGSTKGRAGWGRGFGAAAHGSSDRRARIERGLEWLSQELHSLATKIKNRR